jgi:hypothetical protein
MNDMQIHLHFICLGAFFADVVALLKNHRLKHRYCVSNKLWDLLIKIEVVVSCKNFDKEQDRALH